MPLGPNLRRTTHEQNSRDNRRLGARILQLTWPQVLAELSNIAKRFPEDFGEATDTTVRECVYSALEFNTDFYV